MEDIQRPMFIPDQNHSKVIKIFKVYTDSIVDILVDSTFSKYEILMQQLDLDIPFGSDIWEFFKQNERTLTIYAKKYLEIQELGGDVKKAVLLQNNQYIKFINGLQKKKIGMVKDESMLDPNDKPYWDRQNLFKEIVEKNLIKEYKTGKGKFTHIYTTVDDIFNFFSGSAQTKSFLTEGNLYTNFLNEKGDYYDFNLTKDSIAKYINTIERFFQKKRIRYNNGSSRLNIYTLVNDDITL